MDWIGEVRGRCVKTVLIPATSRKEAEQKLKDGSPDIEGIDVHYTPCGPGRVLRKDGNNSDKQ